MQIDHTTNVIELRDVSFSYGSETVLDHVSLNVHKGDYVGVIGPNGGGKTTLIKILLGLLKPDSGSVRLFGSDIEIFKQRSKIGYVPQKATSFDNAFPASVFEVVSMGLYGKKGLFHGLEATDREKIARALRQVEMLDYKDRIMSDLSGGQQQRVFIARALASHPEVIILDEPTVGVDAKTQASFYKLLKNLHQNFGLTLVLVSHDVEVVAHETTELACVNKTLIYDRNPKDFLATNGLKRMYSKEVKLVFHNH
ncbi:MAG: metal ABC transporter ATP-binding protein [Patescibacteria group bacterium]|jgi:zinc transport system ATP-binding protein